MNNYRYWTLIFENRTFSFYGRTRDGQPQFERHRKVPKDGQPPYQWNGAWEPRTGFSY
jgi:hypothetical protein